MEAGELLNCKVRSIFGTRFIIKIARCQMTKVFMSSFYQKQRNSRSASVCDSNLKLAIFVSWFLTQGFGVCRHLPG